MFTLITRQDQQNYPITSPILELSTQSSNVESSEVAEDDDVMESTTTETSFPHQKSSLTIYEKALKRIFDVEDRYQDSDCENKCRIGGRCLPEQIFALHACALCYSYMPNKLFKKKLQAKQKNYTMHGNQYTVLGLSNGSYTVRTLF